MSYLVLQKILTKLKINKLVTLQINVVSYIFGHVF